MRARLRWRDVAVLTAALGIVCAAASAWAQYPGKPVRVIVPFAAGGTPMWSGASSASSSLSRRDRLSWLRTGRARTGSRRPDGGGIAARRLHPLGHLELVRRQSELPQEAPVRRRPRLRAREQSRGDRGLHSWGQSRPAGAHGAGSDRAGATLRQQDFIRLARRRQRPSPSPPNCSSRSPGHRWYTCPTAGQRLPSPD
jgi:hypothetical protein